MQKGPFTVRSQAYPKVVIHRKAVSLVVLFLYSYLYIAYTNVLPYSSMEV